MRVLAIVPALNEAESLPALLGELRECARDEAWDLEVVVIDDASRDGTATVAREAGARVLSLCRNLGIGGAVQTGLRLALMEGFDAGVQVDGDGQHPPSELVKLVRAAQASDSADMVVGSRYIEKSGFQSTWLRRAGILWLRTLIRLVTGNSTTDPTSGYRFFGRRALRLFAHNYPSDYPEPEALVLASVAGLNVTEVPVKMRERQGGSSSIKSLQAPYYMLKVSLAVLLAFCRTESRKRGS